MAKIACGKILLKAIYTKLALGKITTIIRAGVRKILSGTEYSFDHFGFRGRSKKSLILIFLAKSYFDCSVISWGLGEKTV